MSRERRSGSKDDMFNKPGFWGRVGTATGADLFLFAEEADVVGVAGKASDVSAAAEHIFGLPVAGLGDDLVGLPCVAWRFLRDLLYGWPLGVPGATNTISLCAGTSWGSSRSTQSSGSSDSQAGDEEEEESSKQGEASLKMAGPSRSDRGEEGLEEGARGDREPQGTGEEQSRGSGAWGGGGR